MKKIIALVLAGMMMMATLVGCSKTGEYNNPYSSISLETIKDSLENADAYKHLTIKQSDVDKQLNSSKESLLEQYPEDLAQGTVVEKDDILKIDYVGILDGETEPFEGGSDTDAELTIGSKKFIDGFEDGLIGKKIGDKDIVLDLTFPKDYKDEKEEPELAEKFNGKKVKFTVEIKSGKRGVYNDELIKKAYADNEHEYKNYATIAEFEEGIKKDIYASLAFAEYKKSVKMTQFPEDILNDEYESIMDRWTTYAAASGMSLEQFANSFYAYYYMGSMYNDLQKLAEGVRSQAASTIKDQYLLRYIYLSNKEALDKKYETEYDRIVAETKHEFDEYVEHYGSDMTFEKQYSQEQLKDIVIQQLVSEFLVDFVEVIDDVEPTAAPTSAPSTVATASTPSDTFDPTPAETVTE